MDIQIFRIKHDHHCGRWQAQGEAEALGECVRWAAWRDLGEQAWTVELPRPTGLPIALLEVILEHLNLFGMVGAALKEVECQRGLALAA
jgi:hypothetical protein